MIEYDAAQAYHTCSEVFGTEIANFLIVAFMRRACGSEVEYPEPEGLRELVNEMLEKEGIVG